jgi:hypothetical protein
VSRNGASTFIDRDATRRALLHDAGHVEQHVDHLATLRLEGCEGAHLRQGGQVNGSRLDEGARVVAPDLAGGSLGGFRSASHEDDPVAGDGKLLRGNSAESSTTARDQHRLHRLDILAGRAGCASAYS